MCFLEREYQNQKIGHFGYQFQAVLAQVNVVSHHVVKDLWVCIFKSPWSGILCSCFHSTTINRASKSKAYIQLFLQPYVLRGCFDLVEIDSMFYRKFVAKIFHRLSKGNALKSCTPLFCRQLHLSKFEEISACASHSMKNSELSLSLNCITWHRSQYFFWFLSKLSTSRLTPRAQIRMYYYLTTYLDTIWQLSTAFEFSCMP